MTSIFVCQRLCISQRLLNTNSGLKHKTLQSFCNTNIRNLNTCRNAPILRHRCTSWIPRRNFFKFFRKSTKEQLKVKDDVPDAYILIYRSGMDKYLFYAQLGTTVTAFLVIATAFLKYDYTNSELDFSTWRDAPRQTDNEIYIYITFFVALVVIMQALVAKVPIRIYNLPKQKEYIFVFHGNYPFTQRKLACRVGDVIPVTEEGVLPWPEGRFLIKDKQTLFLLEQHFRRPADLYIMLGVQKDPDVDE